MKCKFKQLEAAMSHFRYSLPSDQEVDVEVTAREESFEQGVVLSCITMVVSYTKKPSSYDSDTQGNKTITRTIEVFPDSENRNPIVTHTERYELKKN